MQGGEIFIPKIPSMKITDLAHTMAPDLLHREIGIRAGEKLHELMISEDDAAIALSLQIDMPFSHLSLILRNQFMSGEAGN